jgi:XTP/dITP diphosphohydrolase
MTNTLQSFQNLLDIMDQLREQCPWDREQTIESLRNLTIEEVYELADAIMKGDLQEVKKEAGDVLLHIVFYAKIGSETGAFTMKDIIDSLCQKLVYRHPHVFGTTTVRDQDEVKQRWEELKQTESAQRKSALAGVPSSLPAMIKANRIQQKARSSGFDWEHQDQVWDKVQEELNELREELRSCKNQSRVEEEFGDFMFSIINAARLFNIDPETALEKTNMKFKRRFEYIESRALEMDTQLKNMTLAEMDTLWEEAKALERDKTRG